MPGNYGRKMNGSGGSRPRYKAPQTPPSTGYGMTGQEWYRRQQERARVTGKIPPEPAPRPVYNPPKHDNPHSPVQTYEEVRRAQAAYQQPTAPPRPLYNGYTPPSQVPYVPGYGYGYGVAPGAAAPYNQQPKQPAYRVSYSDMARQASAARQQTTGRPRWNGQPAQSWDYDWATNTMRPTGPNARPGYTTDPATGLPMLNPQLYGPPAPNNTLPYYYQQPDYYDYGYGGGGYGGGGGGGYSYPRYSDQVSSNRMGYMRPGYGKQASYSDWLGALVSWNIGR